MAHYTTSGKLQLAGCDMAPGDWHEGGSVRLKRRAALCASRRLFLIEQHGTQTCRQSHSRANNDVSGDLPLARSMAHGAPAASRQAWGTIRRSGNSQPRIPLLSL